MQIIVITDDDGNVQAMDWLAKAESVHRQLRPQLPTSYVQRMQCIFEHGARMVIAVLNEAVVGIAVYRVMENTYAGRVLYVDDLITDESQRSQGIGKALLSHCESEAIRLVCAHLELDSGTQRKQAHHFYFREGMVIDSFHFRKTMK